MAEIIPFFSGLNFLLYIENIFLRKNRFSTLFNHDEIFQQQTEQFH